MVQIEVLVKDKTNGLERTITYKSFLDLQSHYELIGQIDDAGKLIEGDPNLQPRHQRQKRSDVHAVGSGVRQTQPLSELIPIKEEIPKEEVKSETEQFPVEQKKRPGRPKTIIA